MLICVCFCFIFYQTKRALARHLTFASSPVLLLTTAPRADSGAVTEPFHSVSLFHLTWLFMCLEKRKGVRIDQFTSTLSLLYELELAIITTSICFSLLAVCFSPMCHNLYQSTANLLWNPILEIIHKNTRQHDEVDPGNILLFSETSKKRSVWGKLC